MMDPPLIKSGKTIFADARPYWFTSTGKRISSKGLECFTTTRLIWVPSEEARRFHSNLFAVGCQQVEAAGRDGETDCHASKLQVALPQDGVQTASRRLRGESFMSDGTHTDRNKNNNWQFGLLLFENPTGCRIPLGAPWLRRNTWAYVWKCVRGSGRTAAIVKTIPSPRPTATGGGSRRDGLQIGGWTISITGTMPETSCQPVCPHPPPPRLPACSHGFHPRLLQNIWHML